ncbi:MAG: SH3 domain-containing protein, partial [Arenimonas sp.]
VAVPYYTAGYWTSKNSCGDGSGVSGVVNTSGEALNVRSGPGTSYSIVGHVSDGATVTIICQMPGTTVTGTYGTSKIWDKIGSGRFVSDAYVRTGSDGYVAPRCT